MKNARRCSEAPHCTTTARNLPPPCGLACLNDLSACKRCHADETNPIPLVLRSNRCRFRQIGWRAVCSRHRAPSDFCSRRADRTAPSSVFQHFSEARPEGKLQARCRSRAGTGEYAGGILASRRSAPLCKPERDSNPRLHLTGSPFGQLAPGYF